MSVFTDHFLACNKIMDSYYVVDITWNTSKNTKVPLGAHILESYCRALHGVFIQKVLTHYTFPLINIS